MWKLVRSLETFLYPMELATRRQHGACHWGMKKRDTGQVLAHAGKRNLSIKVIQIMKVSTAEHTRFSEGLPNPNIVPVAPDPARHGPEWTLNLGWSSHAPTIC